MFKKRLKTTIKRAIKHGFRAILLLKTNMCMLYNDHVKM
jgi:hypothetical protein